MGFVFTIIPILVGLVFLVVIVGMIAHMIMFGTLFSVVAKHIAETADQQRDSLAAQASKPCAYCNAMIPAGVDPCPSCGARR